MDDHLSSSGRAGLPFLRSRHAYLSKLAPSMECSVQVICGMETEIEIKRLLVEIESAIAQLIVMDPNAYIRVARIVHKAFREEPAEPLAS